MSSGVQALGSSSSIYSSEIDPVAAAIGEIYGKDLVACHLKDEEPSLADSLVFQGFNPAMRKSQFELQTGRVVEVVHFKDGSKKCIGSFTYLCEECSYEGWATYHRSSDEQWRALASAQVGEAVEIEDWSCYWNSLQNLLYIKTGMKMSVLEAIYCFSQCSQQRMEGIISALKGAQGPLARDKTLEKNILDIKLLIGFFSFEEGTIFAGGNLYSEILLGSKYATLDEGDWKNATPLTPQTMLSQISAHSFQKDGPLLVDIDEGSYLLYADEAGRPILIDPHNLKRTCNFYAQRAVSEFVVLSRYMTLKTQDLSGKRESYRGLDGVTGLEKDIDVERLGKLLFDVRTKDPLTAESVYKQITMLARQMQECDALFT